LKLRFIAGLLVVAFAASVSMFGGGCGPSRSFKNMPVESWHDWEGDRAKPCMAYNGNPVVTGGPRLSPSVACFDGANGSDPSVVVVGTVELDKVAANLYKRSDKFGVRVLCTKTQRTFECIYDNRDDSSTSEDEQTKQ
jgi:hypothetical protein